MMIAHASLDNDRQLILLGITRGNINKLLRGYPMKMTRKTHGQGIPENIDIAIVFGETEQALYDALASKDLIHPDAKIHIDPTLNVKGPK